MSQALWQPAYIGVGSNLDQPMKHVCEAIDQIADLPRARLPLTSRLYRTKPLGPPGQPDYINAVVGVLCQYTPEALLSELQAIEQAHGRDRSGERWSARTLDLDLLAMANVTMVSERLNVPHPEVHRRDFVLGPWLDVAPTFVVPGLGSVDRLAQEIDLSTLKLVADVSPGDDEFDDM